jgi:hypothetical protein
LEELYTTAGVLIVDAQGHGIISAKIASTVHDTFHALMLAELDQRGKTTPDLFERLNLRLAESVTARNALGRSEDESGREIATMLYGELRPNGHFRFVNFGHPPPLIFSAEHGRFMDVHESRRAQFLALGLQIPEDHPDRNRYFSLKSRRRANTSDVAEITPLVASGEYSDTKNLARDDVIEVDPASGLISIMGGKWTTHRAMAEDTIHTVQQSLGLPQTESKTRNHLLYAGEGFTDDYWKRLRGEQSISEGTARHLADKFGTASGRVLELTVEDPALLHTILPGGRAIRAEVIYAVRSEMAATIEDVLARRLGMQFYSWSDCIEAAPIVGSLMQEELKWTKASTHDVVATYIQKVHRLMDSAGLSRTHALSSHTGESATE